MEPKDGIKCCIIKFSHMSCVSSNLTMNRIVNILKTGISTRLIRLPDVVAEGSKVLVIRIIQ